MTAKGCSEFLTGDVENLGVLTFEHKSEHGWKLLTKILGEGVLIFYINFLILL